MIVLASHGDETSEFEPLKFYCIYVHFRLDFIMEANIMNPDQTAPFGAV